MCTGGEDSLLRGATGAMKNISSPVIITRLIPMALISVCVLVGADMICAMGCLLTCDCAGGWHP